MKKLTSFTVIAALLMSTIMFFDNSIEVKAASGFDKRAIWLSYLDFTTLKDKDETTFRNNFAAICDQSIAQNLNTIIVQARAFSDAIYPSSRYPWATYVTSNPNGPGYDPLANMVQIAHEKGLKIEAWVNPYRISTSQAHVNYFKAHSPKAGWIGTGNIISYGASGMIYNPASSEVQNDIAQGAGEIIANYNVDGIHMDDYFYVNGTFNTTTLQQRKDNVSAMVANVHQKVKSIRPTATFGISPQGNIDNCRNAGADIDRWLSQNGYVDYIMPQIYWSDEWGNDGATKMFSNRLNAWNSLPRNANVKLYAGLALYKVNDVPSGDIGWQRRSDNLLSQAKIAQSSGWNGYSLFRYDYLLKPGTQNELANLRNGINTVPAGFQKYLNASGLKITNNYISGFNPGSEISTILTKLKSANSSAVITISDASGNTKTSQIICTGDRIHVKDEIINIEYRAVVYGDVSGDGKISASDYVHVKNHIMGRAYLLDSAKEAANVNKDAKISAGDYVFIKNYIMGRGTITQ